MADQTHSEGSTLSDNESSNKSEAMSEQQEKPDLVPIESLPEPLAWRHILFRSSANSLYLTMTMFISMLTYGLMVIFFVPVEWLAEEGWQVFDSINALLYLAVVSMLLFPCSLIFQLLIAGMVQNFKRYKWQMEFGGFGIAILLCILFFWPGYFL